MALPLIEITAPATVRTGQGRNGSYEIISQEGYLHTGGRYPDKISLNVESKANEHKEGFYEIDLVNSVERGQYDSLGFKRNLVLKPVPAPKSNPTQV